MFNVCIKTFKLSTNQKFWTAIVGFDFQIKTLPKFSQKYEGGNLTLFGSYKRKLAGVQNTSLSLSK